MNIQEFINQEVEHTKVVIKEELKEGNISREELPKFLNDVNNSLDEIIFTHIRDSVKFDLIDKQTGNYYKTMLGSGKQIDYLDLCEILNRLYSYHHESLEYKLNFEKYSVNINHDILGDRPNNRRIFMSIMVAFGNGIYLEESDF